MYVIPLDLLNGGQRGVISAVEGDSDWVHRLQEMGVAPGREVEMVRPGLPCVVAIAEQRISLRLDDEVTILVEVQGE